MDNRIRILQVVTMMNCGGIENMLMNLYRNIDKSKIQFDFVVHRKKKGYFDDEIKSLGGKIFYAPQYLIANHLSYKNWWNKFFKEHSEYKIIHSHAHKTAPIHLKIANKYGISTIDHVHATSVDNSFKGKIQSLIIKNSKDIAQYLFACSDEAGQWLYGNDCKNFDNYYVVKNAIDTAKYIENKETKNKAISQYKLDGKLVIGHIGRFHPVKNHMFLLSVFEEILKLNKDSVLLLVGDGGEMYEPLVKQIQEKKLEDKIIFTGVTSDVNQYLQIMDCFVFPSINEGLGIAVIEAECVGLPCFINETLPKDLYINKNVYGISLEKSAKEWARIIVNNYDKKISVSEALNNIKTSGYDIKDTVKFLENFYINLNNQGERNEQVKCTLRNK